jgi:putative ABC transport system permease protein
MNLLQAKIFFRTLYRQKANTLINVIGLSTGLASFLVLILFVQYETGHDKHLPNADRVYRVVEIQQAPGIGEQHVAITMGPLAPAIKENLSMVEDAVRLMPAWNYSVVSFRDKSFREGYLFYADTNVFRFFGLDLRHGNPLSALHETRMVALSEEIAIKYFGGADSAIGQPLKFDNDTYLVSAVFANPNPLSHILPKIILPFQAALSNPDFAWLNGWGTNSVITYVKLHSSQMKAQAESLLNAHIVENMPRSENDDSRMQMYLQPLELIYLGSGHIKFQMYDKMGNARQVRLFGVLAFLILVIACINFINLAVAGSIKRSREVGIKKVLGACRYHLIGQFLAEALILTLLSTALALVMTELVLPAINALLSTQLSVSFLDNPIFNKYLLLIVIGVSLFTGAYPAIYLSRFKPVAILKGTASPKTRLWWLNKALIVFQFAASIGMIFSIIVINQQYRFILKKDLGINYHHKIFVPFNHPEAYKKVQVIRSMLLENPLISGIAAASDANGVSGTQGPVTTHDSVRTKVAVRFGFVDEYFFQLMQVPILEGRNFNPAFATDSATVMINQAAARALGWESPIGKKLEITASASSDSADAPVLTVIGVIADYHYYSLRTRIEPAIFINMPARFTGIVIQPAEGINSHKDSLMAVSGRIWHDLFPITPYSGRYIEDQLKQNYQGEKRMLRMFFWFTILSVIISCLGLFGISALGIEQRTREIGIRKALGGSDSQIGLLLFGQFIVMVLAGGILAAPIAWYYIHRMLMEYAYHVPVRGIDLFASVLIGLGIASLAIGLKIIRAASANPVDSLKYE